MGRERIKEGNETRRDQREGKRCKRRGEKGEGVQSDRKRQAVRGKRVVVGGGGDEMIGDEGIEKRAG